MPNNGDSDWSSFVTIVEKTLRGYMGISLSNMAGSAAPVVQDGSVIEVNGSVYQFTTAETITGWPSAAGTTEYIVAVPSGSTITVVYTASAPTWSGTKGGWYDGTDRYIGELTWGGSASYTDKLIYRRYYDNDTGLKFYGDGEIDAGSGEVTALGGITTDNTKRKIKEIALGEWNMDATPSISFAHGLTAGSWRTAKAMIMADPGNEWIEHDAQPAAYAVGPNSYIYFDATNVYIARLTSSYFDGSNFDGTASTVPNRGYITIEYV